MWRSYLVFLGAIIRLSSIGSASMLLVSTVLASSGMGRDDLHPVDSVQGTMMDRDQACDDGPPVLLGHSGPGINPSDGGFGHTAAVGSCSMSVTSGMIGREKSEHEAMVYSSGHSNESVVGRKLEESNGQELSNSIQALAKMRVTGVITGGKTKEFISKWMECAHGKLEEFSEENCWSSKYLYLV
jgi:hypothetical protein